MMKHFLSACTLLLAVTTSSAQTFFLDDNGITIKCIDCVSGDTGIVNGIEYTAVDNAALQAAVDDGLIPLNQLCTSLVTSTASLFFGDSDFDADITSWDMSGVTSTYGMFHGASSFNQPIGHWDVSSVTNMRRMFYNCDVFNRPLDAWDVSSVTDMGSMFEFCDVFNQPLGAWDVSSVTDMGNMLRFCDMFNQPLGAWDVSSVTDMSSMFSSCDVFNQPLEVWDVSLVTDMRYMFYDCDVFNQPLGAWDVSSVTDMSFMFYSCDVFNQPLGAWDISSVTDMSSMFRSCDVFNQPLSGWDVSGVNNMEKMFFQALSFDQDVSNWCVLEIPFEPYDFNSGGQLSQSQLPVWGECPGCVVPEGNCNCQSVDSDNDGICDNEDCSFQFQYCLTNSQCSPSNELLPAEIPDYPLGVGCSSGVSANGCLQHSMLTSEVPETSHLTGFYINMEHTAVNDLLVTVTCPDGGSVDVLSCLTGGGANLGLPSGADYFWSENSIYGTVSSSGAGNIPSATYSVEGDWSALEGCATNGQWTIDICDVLTFDNGVVYDWGVVFESAEGEISMQTASCATSLGCLDESACNYDSEADYDNGQCEYVDECGICGGEGAIYECGCWPEGDCDCEGNQLDAVGVCGGDCAADADADGICDDVDDCLGQYDACGVCNGPGPVFECGCFELPQGNCDCESIDSDGDGICDSEDNCFSLEEDPGSCCELAIAQFDCSFNGIGSCSDTLNVAGWQEVDSLEIYFSYSPSGSSWPGDLALQLITSTGDSVLMGGFWNPISPSDVGGEYLGSHSQIWGWPQNSDSAAVYTQVVDLSAYDLIGEGDWVVTVWNTYTASPMWEVDVVLHGVCGQEGGSCVNDADGDGICDFEDDCIGQYDACGVCGGDGIAEGACDCDGNVLDECGVCGGDGIAEGACDCEGNQLDALGVCGGDCVSDVNGNGICDLEELSESGESMCGQGTVWNEELGVCVVALPTDANFDGCVGINDLLELLAFYGQGCE